MRRLPRATSIARSKSSTAQARVLGGWVDRQQRGVGLLFA